MLLQMQFAFIKICFAYVSVISVGDVLFTTVKLLL